MLLDNQRREVLNEEQSAGNENRNTKSFKIKINGFWVGIVVDENSRRQALGLPMCDLFLEDFPRSYS